ncbi:MAG TPA: glycosyltransferase family 2 protein, partial [Candidatus Binatia bacterium]|nr:glycosyltransferase family 2 protein [Candidatus Binatia bacterium]
WLRALVEVAESAPRIGAVGSRLLDPDGTLQEAGSILWSDGSTQPVGRGLPAGNTKYERVRDVDYCSACGLLVKREAWEAVGGFDERYHPAYYEDVDLCLSLRAHGYRTVYAPEARVVHHGGASSSEGLRLAAGMRSGRLFAAKWAAELHEYCPPPRPASHSASVAEAIHRAESRPLPPLRPPDGPAARTHPTEADLLRAEVRALQGEVALLRSELARREREHAKLERIRSAAWRVPGGRRATEWLSRRLGSGS